MQTQTHYAVPLYVMFIDILYSRHMIMTIYDTSIKFDLHVWTLMNFQMNQID